MAPILENLTVDGSTGFIAGFAIVIFPERLSVIDMAKRREESMSP
jgi:hypothetical protein